MMHRKTKQAAMMYLFYSGKVSCKQILQKKHVPDWHGKLEDIQSLSDIQQSENCVQPEQQREEWMVLADFINLTYTNNFEASSENDWHSYSYSYTPQQLLEMSSWIKSKKQFYESQEQNFNVDINTFSSMQSLADNIVRPFQQPGPSVTFAFDNKWLCWNRQKLPYQCIKKPSAK